VLVLATLACVLAAPELPRPRPPLAGAGQPPPAEDDPFALPEDLKAMIAQLAPDLEKSEYARAVKKRIAAVQSLVEKADRVEVLQLNPRPVEASKQPAQAAFHGYAILRQVRVEKAEQRKELAAFLGKALTWNHFLQALCFNPRHGLRAVQGQHAVDLVICFECNRVKVYDEKGLQSTITVYARKQAIFEAVLRGTDKDK
jgi:hypothetical protein